MKINSYVPDTKIFDKINNSDVNNDSANSNDATINSFSDMLKSKIDEVNNEQVNAENMTESLAKGDDVNVHDVVLATQEATMSLQLAIQIRNKFIDAYQELNRMQI